MNWMIFTKIFRGISLGTTPRDPLGKSVVMMAIRRLKDIRRKKRRQARLAELQFPGGRWGGNGSCFSLSKYQQEFRKRKQTSSSLSISIITLWKVFLENEGQLRNDRHSFVPVANAALDMELGSPSRGWSSCSGCRGSTEGRPENVLGS